MRRRVVNLWIVGLLAPLVLVANMLPAVAIDCKDASKAGIPGQTCCGRCQATEGAPHSCCQPQPACCAKAKTKAAAPCCCQHGAELPAPAAPAPENGPVKQVLLSVPAQSRLVVSAMPTLSADRETNTAADSQAPVRVRFCIWIV